MREKKEPEDRSQKGRSRKKYNGHTGSEGSPPTSAEPEPEQNGYRVEPAPFTDWNGNRCFSSYPTVWTRAKEIKEKYIRATGQGDTTAPRRRIICSLNSITVFPYTVPSGGLRQAPLVSVVPSREFVRRHGGGGILFHRGKPVDGTITGAYISTFRLSSIYAIIP